MMAIRQSTGSARTKTDSSTRILQWIGEGSFGCNGAALVERSPTSASSRELTTILSILWPNWCSKTGLDRNLYHLFPAYTTPCRSNTLGFRSPPVGMHWQRRYGSYAMAVVSKSSDFSAFDSDLIDCQLL